MGKLNIILKSIPNMVTITRIIASILAPILFMTGFVIPGILVYIYGAASDGIDGFLARKLKAFSNLGKNLDAVSDKLFALSVLIPTFLANPLCASLLLLGELSIASIILYSKFVTKNTTHVERIGKYKTCLLFPTLILGLTNVYSKAFTIPFILGTIGTLNLQVKSAKTYFNQYQRLKKNKELNKIEAEQLFKVKSVNDEKKLSVKERTKNIVDLTSKNIHEFSYYFNATVPINKEKEEIIRLGKVKKLTKK